MVISSRLLVLERFPLFVFQSAAVLYKVKNCTGMILHVAVCTIPTCSALSAGLVFPLFHPMLKREW